MLENKEKKVKRANTIIFSFSLFTLERKGGKINDAKSSIEKNEL